MRSKQNHHTHTLVADESLVYPLAEAGTPKKLTKQDFIDKYGIKISLPSKIILKMITKI